MTVVLSEAQWSMLQNIANGRVEAIGSSLGWKGYGAAPGYWLAFTDQDYSDLLALIAAEVVTWGAKVTELGAELVSAKPSDEPPTY
jgi:hypothetical protein